jgi:hypothetical protein
VNGIWRAIAAMKLIYIDEAGNTGKKADPDQPLHMIGALIVDESQVRAIEVMLNDIALEYADLIAKAGHGIRSADLEFHGSEIFGGKKAFAHLTVKARIALCNEIIAACKAGGALFGFAAVDKMKLWTSFHPHMICFQFMLERVQDYLRPQNALGLIVADEHRELEDYIIHDLAFSKRVNTGWGYRPTTIANIVDTVHFVKSKHNRLVQACDVLTYFCLKGLRIDHRLMDKLRVTPMPLGQTWPAYRDAHTTPPEKITREMSAEIQTFQKFSKLWP